MIKGVRAHGVGPSYHVGEYRAPRPDVPAEHDTRTLCSTAENALMATLVVRRVVDGATAKRERAHAAAAAVSIKARNSESVI